jgi:Tfp pilus assembly protein PilX
MNHLSRGSKCKGSKSTSGIALITTLLLLIMLSALATAFVLAVNTENRMQSTDKGSTLAYYGAEAGMEKMMADLNGLYLTTAAPTVGQLQNVGAPGGTCSGTCPYPAVPGMTYTEYTNNPTPSGNPTVPKSYNTTVSSGPNQGLIASVIPMTLAVTAHNTVTQEEVRMVRQVEVALIPVFQFGVFSQSDLDFFAGPTMSIGGRVQTNGDLYLAAGNGGTTTFLGKLRTAKEVVRDTMANGGAVSASHTGTVMLPTATGGCNPPSPPACRAITFTGPDESSWIGGTWPNTILASGNTTGSQNSGWTNISQSTYNSNILAVEDGVVPLKLPFVQSGVSNVEILRRPQTGESNLTTESRLYSKAQIRVLLDDDPAHFPCVTAPCGAADRNNVRLANVASSGTPVGPDYTNGVPVLKTGTACSTSGNPCNTYFAEGLIVNGSNPPVTNPIDPNWVAPQTDDGKIAGTAVNSATGMFPPKGTVGVGANPSGAPNMSFAAPYNLPTGDLPAPGTGSSQRWNLLDGWLRIEARQADGSYVPVTREWLELGFARNASPPTVPATGNNVHPDAIILLQQLAFRGALPAAGTTPATFGSTYPPGLTNGNGGTPYMGTFALPLNPSSPSNTVPTAINFYPINMYDAREGEPRELTGNFGCSANGVINLTEIDVGNLQRWLSGATGSTGTNVENQSQNGYILYFSDHRGMIPENMQPAATGFAILGAYGFEDLINPASGPGTPNNTMDAAEDVEAPGDSGATSVGPPLIARLETYGSANLGLGFGYAMGGLAPTGMGGTGGNGGTDEVFSRLNRCDIGRTNWVSGARHGVRLVDGGSGNLPLRPNGDPLNVGGFTLASDNPAYILGNYNASPSGWQSTDSYAHASAAVIADTVTLLSGSWNDLYSFASPGNVNGNGGLNVTGRAAQTTYYRVAISSGKNVNCPIPTYPTGGAPIGGASTDRDKSGLIANVPTDFCTDGGVHNFLRYLENWTGQSSNYNGSMVSLYYAEYTTGIFKCCQTVYRPPTRNYQFDLDFTDISKMPPGTPRFQEVINVGYKQDLNYR